jgi:hypothetical protein
MNETKEANCPFKVGDKIEGKEVKDGILGMLTKDVWHAATVEKVDGDLMLIFCPTMFSDKKVWVHYLAGWFRKQEEKT